MNKTVLYWATRAVVIGLSCVPVAVAWESVRALDGSQGWVSHTLEVQRDLEQILSMTLDVQASVREFAATGNEGSLANVLRVRAERQKIMAETKLLTSDNPVQGRNFLVLDAELAGVVATADRILSTRSSGDREAALAILREIGPANWRRFSGQIATMQAEEQRLLDLRKVRTQRQRRLANLFELALGLACLIGGLGFALFERRSRLAQAKATAKLEQSERRFRVLVDGTDQAILLLGPTGLVESWNAGAELLIGYTAAEAIGRPFSDIYRPEDVAAGLADQAALQLVTAGKFEDEGLRMRKDRTEFWASTSARLIKTRKGNIRGFSVIVRDISDRKLAELALLETKEKLERSNRELQDFAMIASHDLQEPLRKIRTFGDRLRSHSGKLLDEKGLHYLERMQNGAERGQTLVEGLLAFSRVTTKAQPHVPVDLAKVAEEVVGDLEARIRLTSGRVDLAKLPTLAGDPLQMRQLLQNLIGNALKFHKPHQPAHVGVYATWHPEASEWHLCVRDAGVGFDDKYNDRIFALFQRLHDKSEFEGSGVGLAICRKIVERHRGRIVAKSAVNAGTTFTVSLPASVPPAAPETWVAEPTWVGEIAPVLDEVPETPSHPEEEAA